MKHTFFAALLLAACVLGACAEQDTHAPTSAETSEFESPYFAVTTSGSGPDVILVPGLASSGAVWDGTVAALSDRFTLHVVQVNGFAGAPALGNENNDNILEDLATDLSAYSRELAPSPVLIGHSLGGLVAIKTALHPDTKLSRLVIVDVLPFFSVLMDPDATAESIAPVSEVMKVALLGQSDDQFALRQAEALSALVKGEDDLEQALNWSVESDRAVMAQAMSEVLTADLRGEMSTLAVPTHIIFAKDDTIPNMAEIEAFYRTLYAPVPDHSLIAIENALHFVMLDQPAAFYAALEGLLAE